MVHTDDAGRPEQTVAADDSLRKGFAEAEAALWSGALPRCSRWKPELIAGNNYVIINGPVVNSQLAWDNNSVRQWQERDLSDRAPARPARLVVARQLAAGAEAASAAARESLGAHPDPRRQQIVAVRAVKSAARRLAPTARGARRLRALCADVESQLKQPVPDLKLVIKDIKEIRRLLSSAGIHRPEATKLARDIDTAFTEITDDQEEDHDGG